MRKIRDVLRLKFEAGVGERQIASALGVARSTVQEALRRAREGGVSWPLPPELDEAALHARLYPQRAVASTVPLPDFPAIHQALSRKGVTRNLLGHLGSGTFGVRSSFVHMGEIERQIKNAERAVVQNCGWRS